MKVPRFVKEYANYQISQFNQIMEEYPEFYKACIDRINKTFECYEKGLLTINETMKIINQVEDIIQAEYFD